MFKLKEIFIGAFIGIISVSVIIAIGNYRAEAEGEDTSGSSSYVAGTDSKTMKSLAKEALGSSNGRLDYNDVFGSATVKNMYILIYQFLLVKPEEDALKDAGRSYGFTEIEMESIQQGS